MDWQPKIPSATHTFAGQVVLVEGEAGAMRRATLQRWLQDAAVGGAATWLLTCDFEEGGVWAGVKELFQQLLPRLEEIAPHLILQHGYELTVLLPHLRGKIPVPHPLTETAPMGEKVRNYPIDRAYRVVHGLVNLLTEWHRLTGGGRGFIVCDYYDHAGAMANRFFAELMRRRGAQLRLTLLLVTSPAAGANAVRQYDPAHVGRAVRLDLPPEPRVPLAAEEAARLADEFEARVDHDLTRLETYLPQLIRYNLLSGREERALRLQAMALGMNNHSGFYEDALKYSEPVAANLERLSGDDEVTRWNLVGNLFGCYVAVGDTARAYRIVVDEALEKLKRLEQRVKVYYVMGMLYGRFLPEPDLGKAAAYLEQGLQDIARTDLPPDEKSFHTAFTMNGLAFVRNRQGRPDEAISLCRSASELLDAHLRPDQHRLHRSVLQYNIAQVYAFTGRLEDAVTFYSAAMEMDPNYSEYYNERGSAYLKLDRLDRALADFLKAVELSPPYPEVMTNLGQCHQLLGDEDEAIKAYSVSLDLVPTQVLAFVGRAQAYDAAGQSKAALADYSTALALDPAQPLVLSNRAILHYEQGDVLKALADLDQAITLSPGTADLYQNRATAMTELGRTAEAAADLRTYLRLAPAADDRAEVESKLSALEAAVAPV